MKKIALSLVLAGFTALSLSACTVAEEQFDFSKKAPDEFAVVTRAPLEMPPNYTLRPPRPGAQRPQENTSVDEAKQVIFGVEDSAQKKVSKEPMTEGESILLQKTGAASVTPNIRDIIDQETVKITKEATPTIDRILGKVGKKIDAPATVVDPVKETERIIQNKKSGKPITDGKTPTIND